MSKYSSLGTQFPCLGIQGVANIILVGEGQKPACTVTLQENTPQKDADWLLWHLGSFGLHAEQQPPQKGHSDIYIHIARTFGYLTLLEYFFWQKDFPDHHEGLGKVLGYPESAIRGYVAKAMADEEAVLPRVLNEDELLAYRHLRPFRLSKENWQEEVSVVKMWLATIQTASPGFYRELLSLPIEAGGH